MDHITNHLQTAVAQATGHSPIQSETKPAQSSSDLAVTPFTVAQVAALFSRMGALFRNKAKSEGLMMFANPAHESAGIFTETFKLWCVKLKDLQVEHFARGTLEMEKRAEEIYRAGDDKGHREMWPPSFAEFRGMCFPSSDFDHQAHRMLPSAWDPVAMCYRLEDLTAKAERMKNGMVKTSELFAILGDTKERLTPEQTAEAQEFARKRLEDAKRIVQSKAKD